MSTVRHTFWYNSKRSSIHDDELYVSYVNPPKMFRTTECTISKSNDSVNVKYFLKFSFSTFAFLIIFYSFVFSFLISKKILLRKFFTLLPLLSQSIYLHLYNMISFQSTLILFVIVKFYFIFFFLILYFQLLCINPEERITTVKKLKSVPCISRYNFGMILEKQIRPPFTPPVSHILIHEVK